VTSITYSESQKLYDFELDVILERTKSAKDLARTLFSGCDIHHCSWHGYLLLTSS